MAFKFILRMETSKSKLDGYEAEDQYNQGCKETSQLPEIITNTDINEVYVFVLGKEKHGAVRGFGIGVKPDDVLDVLVEKRGAQLKVQALREEHETELDLIQKESQEREDKL